MGKTLTHSSFFFLPLAATSLPPRELAKAAPPGLDPPPPRASNLVPFSPASIRVGAAAGRVLPRPGAASRPTAGRLIPRASVPRPSSPTPADPLFRLEGLNL
ncbi:hypothetical protein BS78_04G260900 [Paspalum vaginatum]|nr:hypothetical protein BS78_04G260900 [Paspalum vaginatum]